MGQKARRERYDYIILDTQLVHLSDVSRMREIEMNEHDADLYAKTLGKVRNQIQALRTMLSSIEVMRDTQSCICTYMHVYIRTTTNQTMCRRK